MTGIEGGSAAGFYQDLMNRCMAPNTERSSNTADREALLVELDRRGTYIHVPRPTPASMKRTAPRVRACLVERSEFEPAVPILEQPDDSWLFGSTAL
jgi:hypothetical protein